MSEFLTGELLTAGRTGVIVAISHEITYQQAAEIREALERNFPGVTFGIVSGCSGVASFTFDDETTS